MGIAAEVSGRRRGGSSNNALMPISINGRNEQLLAQGLPPYTEMGRLGQLWMVQDSNALAAVTALPTTTAGLTLWNGDPSKSYIIDRIFAAAVVTTAAVSGFSLAYTVHPTGMTKPTADITAIKNQSGKSGYNGNAIVDSGATVNNDGWIVCTNQVNTSGVTTASGGGVFFEAQGRIIVPPTGGVSVKAFGNITNLTFLHAFTWFEVLLDLE